MKKWAESSPFEVSPAKGGDDDEVYAKTKESRRKAGNVMAAIMKNVDRVRDPIEDFSDDEEEVNMTTRGR